MNSISGSAQYWISLRVRLFTCALILLGCSSPAFSTTLSANLSADELQFAGGLAANRPWLQSRSAVQTGAHPLQIQTLSVEMDERKKNNQQRRARVYQFNYLTQRSRLILVDLDTRALVSETPINSIHLPLNEQEIATARSLVEQNPASMTAMNIEQQSRGLPELEDLSGIDVKAIIFEPRDQTHPCAKQRCALISLFDHTRTVFSVEPLVNLQSLSVTTLQQSLQ